MTGRLKTVYPLKLAGGGGGINSFFNSLNFELCEATRVRLISVPLTLEERFVRFSCVALPFYPIQVRYSYGDIR